MRHDQLLPGGVRLVVTSLFRAPARIPVVWIVVVVLYARLVGGRRVGGRRVVAARR